MAKRADSRYEQRRSRHWLKVKVRPRQELVVAGYTKGQRKRERMGALVLAVQEQGGCAGRATSARASRRTRSTSCSPA